MRYYIQGHYTYDKSQNPEAYAELFKIQKYLLWLKENEPDLYDSVFIEAMEKLANLLDQDKLITIGNNKTNKDIIIVAVFSIKREDISKEHLPLDIKQDEEGWYVEFDNDRKE